MISFEPRPPVHLSAPPSKPEAEDTEVHLSAPPSKPEAEDTAHVDEDLLRLREECTLMPDVPVRA